MDTDMHTVTDAAGKVKNAPQDVIIGDDVWIGCRCLILKGAQVPDLSVIGANSVITKKLEDASALYAGVPVKKVKDNIKWHM